jgi:hypothetical protein
MNFTPSDWFWKVGDDASRFWSSTSGGYVQSADPDRTTNVADEDQLSAVLRHLGITPVPKPSEDDYTEAIQSLIDGTAQSKQYTDGNSCATYALADSPPGTNWKAEAQAFIAWRGAVWAQAFATLADVRAGTIPRPTIADLIAGLPVIAWPD